MKLFSYLFGVSQSYANNGRNKCIKEHFEPGCV